MYKTFKSKSAHNRIQHEFNLKYFIVFSMLAFLFLNCKKEDDIEAATSELRLFTNTELIIADGTSAANIQLFENDRLVQQASDYILRVNGEVVALEHFDFKTAQPGVHELEAEYKGVTSNVVRITAREDKELPLYKIPIIFHVGHFGTSVATLSDDTENPNISKARIDAFLEILNQSYRNQLGSTEPNAVDTFVQFRLATIDPNGNQMSEPGIDRHNVTPFDRGCFEFPNDTTCPDFEEDKTLGPNEIGHFAIASIWDPNEYFNVWLYHDQEGRGAANVAALIFEDKPLIGTIPVARGSVIEPSLDSFEHPFPSCYLDFRRLESIAHEVGHVFALDHPFSQNCERTDYCADTYSYNFDTKQACIDNLGSKRPTSFMDYVGERNCFTYDQRERIRHVLNYGYWFGSLKDSEK